MKIFVMRSLLNCFLFVVTKWHRGSYFAGLCGLTALQTWFKTICSLGNLGILGSNFYISVPSVRPLSPENLVAYPISPFGCLFQGTAKVPKYTVIVDDSSFSMDELEMMTYGLCYCHQIVNLPTSVPTPLYVATRYAERSRRIIIER